MLFMTQAVQHWVGQTRSNALPFILQVSDAHSRPSSRQVDHAEAGTWLSCHAHSPHTIHCSKLHLSVHRPGCPGDHDAVLNTELICGQPLQDPLAHFTVIHKELGHLQRTYPKISLTCSDTQPFMQSTTHLTGPRQSFRHGFPDGGWLAPPLCSV
jgi:hypothetical protein